jgi:outer membrane receptor protein involved in Fe transport
MNPKHVEATGMRNGAGAECPTRSARRRRITTIAGLLVLGAATAAEAQVVALQPVVVTAVRSETGVAQSPFASRLMSGHDVQDAPALTVDSALRSVPSFTLFRRSDSLTAHPTAQGVSLRGLGPSGASRSLVLLDGIPLNDPFGGWVAWSKVPRESLVQVEMVPGAGAAAWGNAALGGVLQLTSAQPGVRHGRISGMLGDFETHSVEFDATERWGASALQLGARLFSTEGYRIVAPESRGTVDTPAGQRHRWFTAKWTQTLSRTAEASVNTRWFREKRSNGTAYQQNETEEFFVSGNLKMRPSDVLGVNATGYFQDQAFSSTFGAVNASRSSETPASDQFDVPAKAAGAALVAELGAAGEARTTLGADARYVEGESNELFTFTNGAFTRQRSAGGEQMFAGMFVLHQRPFTDRVHVTLGARVDHWADDDGFRDEHEIATGLSLRSDRYRRRSGWEWSPSAGVNWKASDRIQVRASVQRAFRRPTLNELYRPFRVGNIITEANAALETEHVDTAELALGYDAGLFSAEVAMFWNVLKDAVSNVTVARGPGTVPGFGFIPAGGLGRRRENIEEAWVRGVEAVARWRIADRLRLTTSLLLNDTEVRRSELSPALVGKRLAQVPALSGVVELTWDAPMRWRVSPRMRAFGAQFEDDENQLRLAPGAVFDLSLSRELNQHVEFFGVVENLFNERIETGRSSAGVINVGTPRMATAGVRLRW